MRKTMEERFWAKVNKTDGCWEWTAHKLFNGYGRFSINKKPDYSHRVSWLIAHGEYPTGKHVLHTCDNPGCVRPDHLVLGTMGDNMADRDSKHRQYTKKKLHCRHGKPFSYRGRYRIAKTCKVCETSRRYKQNADPVIAKQKARMYQETYRKRKQAKEQSS